MDSSRTSSSTTSSNVTNGYIPPSENFYEVPFDRNEWLVSEPFSEKPHYSSYITWINKKDGLFTILLPTEVARLWEKVKHRQTSKEMDYQTFSRGLRAYYTNGIMIKTYKKYTFCFNQSMTPE
ncbi:hypothetical protein I4U23_024573 [Adineta vaga]|nr:hypothetical protein I4U23_024573 [Adineta vaga]